MAIPDHKRKTLFIPWKVKRSALRWNNQKRDNIFFCSDQTMVLWITFHYCCGSRSCTLVASGILEANQSSWKIDADIVTRANPMIHCALWMKTTCCSYSNVQKLQSFTRKKKKKPNIWKKRNPQMEIRRTFTFDEFSVPLVPPIFGHLPAELWTKNYQLCMFFFGFLIIRLYPGVRDGAVLLFRYIDHCFVTAAFTLEHQHVSFRVTFFFPSHFFFCCRTYGYVGRRCGFSKHSVSRVFLSSRCVSSSLCGER